MTFENSGTRIRQECDSNFRAPTILTSPNHPQGYDRNSNCRYCVKSQALGMSDISFQRSLLKLYSLGNFVSLEISNLKLDARRNCYPGKDYMIIENVDGTPISSPICTLIRRNPIRAMAQNALCVKLGLLKVHFLFLVLTSLLRYHKVLHYNRQLVLKIISNTF